MFTAVEWRERIRENREDPVKQIQGRETGIEENGTNCKDVNKIDCTSGKRVGDQWLKWTRGGLMVMREESEGGRERGHICPLLFGV